LEGFCCKACADGKGHGPKCQKLDVNTREAKKLCKQMFKEKRRNER
jgi:hypothetical protein